jgi:hypothetical protein
LPPHASGSMHCARIQAGEVLNMASVSIFVRGQVYRLRFSRMCLHCSFHRIHPQRKQTTLFTTSIRCLPPVCCWRPGPVLNMGSCRLIPKNREMFGRPLRWRCGSTYNGSVRTPRCFPRHRDCILAPVSREITRRCRGISKTFLAWPNLIVNRMIVCKICPDHDR